MSFSRHTGLVEEVLGLAVAVERAVRRRSRSTARRPSPSFENVRRTSDSPSGRREADPWKITSSIAVAAEGLGALLAERPAERVGDVRLAAAVRDRRSR